MCVVVMVICKYKRRDNEDKQVIVNGNKTRPKELMNDRSNSVCHSDMYLSLM